MEICNPPLSFFYWRFFSASSLCCYFVATVPCWMDYCWVDPGCPAFVGICLAWSVFCRLFGCWLAGVMPVLHPIDVDLRLLNVVRKYIFSEFLSWFCCSGFNLFMPEFIYLWHKIKQKSDTWIAAGFSFVYFRVKWSGPVATEKIHFWC